MATNIVTNVGLDALLEAWLATYSLYLGVGSSSTTPAVGDTTLGTEITRVATTNESASASGGEGTAIVEAFFTTSQGNGTITEWGIFDASSNGNLSLHGQPNSSVTKTSAKQMRVTLTLKLRQAT